MERKLPRPHKRGKWDEYVEDLKLPSSTRNLPSLTCQVSGPTLSVSKIGYLQVVHSVYVLL